jgi:hypothetical protein
MALHDIIRITVLGRAMGEPHIITGARTRRQEAPHTVVLLAAEPMAIASSNLTIIIKHGALSLHLKAILPLAGGLLTPKVIILRIDALTTSKVKSRTAITTARRQTIKGHHKGVAPISALRNTVGGVLMTIAAIFLQWLWQ